MDKIILTTKAELEEIIQSAVRLALKGAQSQIEIKPKSVYFSVNEAADYVQLAVQTIYQLTSSRSIPFIKKGKKLYFLQESLDLWLLEGKRKSKNELIKEANEKM